MEPLLEHLGTLVPYLYSGDDFFHTYPSIIVSSKTTSPLHDINTKTIFQM